MNFEQTDVVFVIEKSISLKRYLNELLESYITPAISYFSGGINEESDVFFTQSSMVQYALVFYGSELTVLGSSRQVETQGPTTSQNSIINAIKDANYCYKNTCRQAYILEALQTAIEVFKNLSGGNIQKDSVKRCLVLVTQSSPITNPWASATPENIIQELKRGGIKTSIISAHKLVELYRLFESTGGDHQSIALKNYASKPQHLVLLNGFTLQERAVSPSLISQPSAVGVSTPPVGAQMGATNQPPTGPPPPNAANPTPGQPHNRPIPSPVPHTGSPAAPPQPPQQPNQVTMTRSSLVLNPNAPPQPMPPQTQVSGGMIRGPPVGNQNPTMPPMNARARWAGAGPMMVPTPQPGLQTPQLPPQIAQQQQPGGQMPPQAGTFHVQGPIQQQQPQPQGGIPCGGGMGVPPSQVSVMPQAGARTVSPSIIWQGTLEWSEKKHMAGSGSAIQRIPCKISSQSMNGKLEIKTDGWPSTLQMLLVQKNLLSSVGNTYFQNIHKVMFYPDPCPALESLTSSLSLGYAGCVHLSSSCSDVKMIILLFSPDKRAYVGFIPLDQIAFVTKIKQVFQSQSRNMQSQQQQQLHQQQQAVNKQNVGNPMLQGVNSTQNMQMIPNPGMPQSSMMMQQNQLNPAMAQQGGMPAGNPMVSGVSSTQIVGTPGQGMGMGMGQGPPQQTQQMAMGTHVQQQQIGPPQNQAVLGTKLIRPINVSGQQQQQATDPMQIRQTLQPPNIRHQLQLQQQQQQRPPLQVNLAQPRMITPQMRTILQQQRLHQQQQQQMLLIQQQNMRPQMNQTQQVMGQQVMGQQGMGQQGMGQQGMGQQGMGQQALGQQGMGQQALGQQAMGQQSLNQGMGQPMQDNTTDYMDLI